MQRQPESTHINTHTQQYTWLATSPAFLSVFPLSFPDLIRSHKLMSKESAAGHNNTEGKLPCFSQCLIAVMGACLCLCLHLGVADVFTSLFLPPCNKAGADRPVQSKQRVAEAADCTA